LEQPKPVKKKDQPPATSPKRAKEAPS
jgi:hypothetical protein